MKRLYILLLCELPAFLLLAQKAPSEVLGKPSAFARPIEMEEAVFNQRYLQKEIKDYTPKVPWIVVADRDDAKTHSYPSDGAETLKSLDFGEYFYVAEEKSEWIRIGKANVNGVKVERDSWQEIGWIKKKNILLWTNALQDALTGIHKKAFLLNKVSEVAEIIRLDKKEIVPIYTSPNGNKTIGNKTIFEFYFILKKENDRYLLAKDAILTSRSAAESLVGWVRESRVAEWNTRIALEPNFEPDAYNERKANPNLLIAAYGKEDAANSHAETGITKKDQAYWRNDPASLDPSQLADSNMHRFKGGVMRFPMLKDNTNYFRTGVIGDITTKTMSNVLDKINEVNYSGLIAAYEKSKMARENYNIVFAIEGTPNMEPYRQSIIDAIQNLDKTLEGVLNVRIGVAVYRDVEEEQHGKLFQVLRLTSSKEDAINYVKNIELARWSDNDTWTSMYYGVYQALLEAGYKKEDTNLLVLMGENADFRSDKLRRMRDEKHKSLVKAEEIVEKLCDLNVHLLSMQVRNQADVDEHRLFAKQVRNFMFENAKCQHDLIRGVPEYMPEITIKNPTIADINDKDTKYELKGGTTVARIYRPSQGQGMKKDEYAKQTLQAIDAVHEFVEDFWKKMSSIIIDGNGIGDVSSGEFDPTIGLIMSEYMKGSGNKQWTKEDVKKLANQKYKLYAEVFVPKKIKGSRHDAFSFVLFMPRTDLEEYLNTLRKLSVARDGTPEAQRDQLFNTMIELLKQFTGDQSLKNNDPKNTTVEELRRYMQGVSKEGLKLGTGMDDFFIQDIRSNRKVPDEKVKQFVDRILNNTEMLSKILKEGKSHEFIYTTGNDNYYWVPIEYTF